MQAFCPKCGKPVAAFPVFNEAEFWAAIDNNKDVEVMHFTDEGDHLWVLGDQERENLRKQRTQGTI